MGYEFMPPDAAAVTLTELAGRLSVHYSTVRNWTIKGRCGVKLRVCRLPTGIGSSMGEYHRFLARLTETMEDQTSGCDA